MSNDSIGAPIHFHSEATPAERLIYASGVLLDFQSGTRILSNGQTVGNVPQQDKEWAAEMGRAQNEKGERPMHPDQEIEASLHAGEVVKKIES